MYYLVLEYVLDENFEASLIQSNDIFTVDQVIIDDILELFLKGQHGQVGDEFSDDLPLLKMGDYRYIIDYEKDLTVNKVLLLVSDGTYGANLTDPIRHVITIGFISIIILGNAIILLWSSVMVDWIKKLKDNVEILSSTSYTNPIKFGGNDEITELALSIDNLRVEILDNEIVKTEMLQNISHDIKTLIAVIRSYAEEIHDGITGIDDLDIIIKQSEILSQKVRQLLEWNKLEYIKNPKDYKEISIRRILENISNNYKYRNEIEFHLDLDDSKLFGIEDNYYSMFNNIVENGLRYAKSEIRITLKNKKITIFNDGEPISDVFLTGTFKPYE